MDLFKYPGDGTVMAHHDVINPDNSTTPHYGPIDLSSLTYQDEEEKLLRVPCPIKGCPDVSYVPLYGDREAQLLHAAVRHAHGKYKSLIDAADALMKEVMDAGHDPLIRFTMIDTDTNAAYSMVHRTEPIKDNEPETPTIPDNFPPLLANMTSDELAIIAGIFQKAQQRQADQQSAAMPPVNPYVPMKSSQLGDMRLK